jgi:hypothetical protein
MHGTKWVYGFVSCAACGRFQGRVGTGFSSITSQHQALMVLGTVLLCTDGASGFLCFTEFGVTAITLAVMILRGWGLGEVFLNVAFLVTEKKCISAKVGYVEGSLEGDNYGQGPFVELAFSGDKPMGFSHEFDGWVG